ncbi:ArsR/SmtB family transcription factor [Pseudomonas profundi]|uniref:ArsR/SmtB family transcription factor n=1 Tax=Pseudomonas profundi TaxID=1981513 RepID=UPI0012388C8F|nr:metalloregulator ArsR/SmtB family transcription factor [Pseudomonas profundi]
MKTDMQDILVEVAEVARALGHPARLRIVELLLKRHVCVGGEIVEALGLAQSTVSEHLRILKQANIVCGEIERPHVCYSLTPDGLELLSGWLRPTVEKVQQHGALCAADGPCNPQGVSHE